MDFGVLYIVAAILVYSAPLSDEFSLSLCKYFQSDEISCDPDDVEFYLYPNSENVNDYDKLIFGDINSISKSRFDSSKALIIFSHGYSENYLSKSPTVVKNAYLKAGFYKRANIVVVNWGKLAFGTNESLQKILMFIPGYKVAAYNVPKVGRRLAEFIIFLYENRKLSSPRRVHLVGHSLGAHISGIAGDYFEQSTSLILGRITGTDPASVLFQGASPADRLDSTDALFVDVIHTNQGEAGYIGPLGDADFFVNGGGPTQPDCSKLENIDNVICSHALAPRYFALSILSSNYLGYKCELPCLNFFDGGRPFNLESQVIGQYCSPRARGLYFAKMELPESKDIHFLTIFKSRRD